MAVPGVTVAGFPLLSPAFLARHPVWALSSSTWKLFPPKETMKVELKRAKIPAQSRAASPNESLRNPPVSF